MVTLTPVLPARDGPGQSVRRQGLVEFLRGLLALRRVEDALQGGVAALHRVDDPPEPDDLLDPDVLQALDFEEGVDLLGLVSLLPEVFHRRGPLRLDRLDVADARSHRLPIDPIDVDSRDAVEDRVPEGDRSRRVGGLPDHVVAVPLAARLRDPTLDPDPDEDVPLHVPAGPLRDEVGLPLLQRLGRDSEVPPDVRHDLRQPDGWTDDVVP